MFSKLHICIYTMNIHIYGNIYLCAQSALHIYIYIFIFIYIYIYIYIYIFIFIYIYILYIFIYLYIYLYIYIYIYIFIYIYIYICIYIYSTFGLCHSLLLASYTTIAFEILRGKVNSPECFVLV